MRFPKGGGWNSLLDKLWHFWRMYIGIAVSGLKSTKTGDTLITWQVFVGVIVGLLIRIFKLRRKLIILSFIYKPRKNWLVNRLRFLITRMGLRAASKVVCYSSSEERAYSQLFSLPDTEFCFVPLGKTFVAEVSASLLADDATLFAAGQSNRDYQTLLDAMANVDAKLTIATTNQVIVPDYLADRINVEPLEGVDFRMRMATSSLVILPLEDTGYSSGQIVLINAMAQSRCVIMTQSTWSSDYVIHGRDVWLVPPKDSNALAEAIRALLNDPIRREHIGHHARECYDKSFNGARFGERIAQIAKGV
ncbi:glycosyltransferase [Gemmatimonadota bacterium]